MQTSRPEHAPSESSDSLLEPEGNFEALFLDHLEYVEHVIGFIVRRHALPYEDAQDFDGWVKLRLIQDDYAVLRKFRGRSKLTTFLTTVIHNLHRDFRIQRWGKWRPSASAARLGEEAVQLEALLFRDRYGLEEAIKLLRENYDVDLTEKEIEGLASQLRPRVGRRFETEMALIHAAAPERIEDDLLADENRALWSKVHRRVRKEIDDLSAEDRVILRLRFEEGLTVAAIARELDRDQRKLYGHLNRLLNDLRRRLEPGESSMSSTSPSSSALAPAPV